MSEVTTQVDPSVDYKTAHLLPRLRESVDAAAGYVAASLQDNTDSPEREIIKAAQHWRRAQGESPHVAEVDATRLIVVRAWFRLRKAVDVLNEFESRQSK